jgi:hypothetical protein
VCGGSSSYCIGISRNDRSGGADRSIHVSLPRNDESKKSPESQLSCTICFSILYRYRMHSTPKASIRDVS